ncbi:hypothetical protein B0H11DRAFT_2131635 [Mycena galericulata]|nr:hypothetical protein B0H11DRAFT_2131635 [Mycena galericulata]
MRARSPCAAWAVRAAWRVVRVLVGENRSIARSISGGSALFPVPTPSTLSPPFPLASPSKLMMVRTIWCTRSSSWMHRVLFVRTGRGTTRTCTTSKSSAALVATICTVSMFMLLPILPRRPDASRPRCTMSSVRALVLLCWCGRRRKKGVVSVL